MRSASTKKRLTEKDTERCGGMLAYLERRENLVKRNKQTESTYEGKSLDNNVFIIAIIILNMGKVDVKL